MSYYRYIGWLVISLILSACGERIGLAPVVQGGKSQRVPLSSAITPKAGPVVIVQRGQTLYKIARLRNVGLRNLIDANNLTVRGNLIWDFSFIKVKVLGSYV